MKYFEEGKTYTYDEIKEIYTDISDVELKELMESIKKSGINDIMFSSMISMLCMQTLSNLDNKMFAKRTNKESEE